MLKMYIKLNRLDSFTVIEDIGESISSDQYFHCRVHSLAV